jgi:hypothetical protein
MKFSKGLFQFSAMIAICMAHASYAHAQCDISFNSPSRDFKTVFEKKYRPSDIKDYDSICQKLNSAGVGVGITESAFTVNGATVIVVGLFMYEPNKRYAVLDYESSSIMHKMNADISDISDAKYAAFINAMNGWKKIDSAISRFLEVRNNLNAGAAQKR